MPIDVSYTWVAYSLHKEYKPHELRVVNERAELEDKLNKLDKFIYHSDLFKALDQIDKDLLEHQLRYMKFYVDILNKRIARFKNPDSVVEGAHWAEKPFD